MDYNLQDLVATMVLTNARLLALWGRLSWEQRESLWARLDRSKKRVVWNATDEEGKANLANALNRQQLSALLLWILTRSERAEILTGFNAETIARAWPIITWEERKDVWIMSSELKQTQIFSHIDIDEQLRWASKVEWDHVDKSVRETFEAHFARQKDILTGIVQAERELGK